jgi:hypothetical protein
MEYLGHIPDERWRPLLASTLERADSFRVHMPDGDGPLSHGRAEFTALAGVGVHPWSGMKDAIEIAGPLTPEARTLFLTTETSLESYDAGEKLWDYQLLRGDTVLLSIGDFHDLMVPAP